jgi:magnesium-transporting ATPase (P-type)
MVISGIKETVRAVKEEFSNDNFDFDSDDKYPFVSQFFINFAICNTVMIEKHRFKKEISYKATSPDELALVKGAKNSGIQLVSREYD